MSFDSIPEDKEESYPCPECGGSVTKQNNYWECDSCEFCANDSKHDEVSP